MPTSPPAAPLRFDPSMERPEAEEAETAEGLTRTMLGISETTLKDGGKPLRSVHAKSHGLLRGELRVLDGLPDVLAQGLFARPATYPAVLRLSTIPGDILDDSVSTPRGLAIKVLDVAGDRLAGSEDDKTQDFLLVNGPAFLASTGKEFLGSLKLLAATTDTPQAPKKAISAALRAVESVVEAFGGKSPTLISLGGQPETHILGETFWSQVPILYGDYIAKLSVVPVSPELAALANAPLDVNGKPNGLREAVVEFFHAHGGEWELRVQLCTNLETMPIEDASVVWSEDESPFVPVARIRVEPQAAWTQERSATVDDGFSFNPWHGLAAHRPLGAIMRMRKRAYDRVAHFRREKAGRDQNEPTSLDNLPGFVEQTGPTPDRGATQLVAVSFTINDVTQDLRVAPWTTLLDLLRLDLDLTGTKKGCDHGQCGACTVLIDGQRMNSCLQLVVMQEGKSITTIEGLAENGQLHPLQQAFIEHDAFQCGYCTPGQICSAAGLLNEGRAQSRDEIRELMSGNICRCGAYPNIVDAVEDVIKQGAMKEAAE